MTTDEKSKSNADLTAAELTEQFPTAHSLQNKLLYLQQTVDPKLRLFSREQWSAAYSDHRISIRLFLAERFSFHFTREQQALLYDLNWRPQSRDGFVSIAHCQALGGFSFSARAHGFDMEELHRISVPILNRTASEAELALCPRREFLWCAKEAGFKALSEQVTVITDLVCTDWQSHFENQIWSYRLISHKTLDLELNKGFIFLDQNILYALYFR